VNPSPRPVNIFKDHLLNGPKLVNRCVDQLHDSSLVVDLCVVSPLTGSRLVNLSVDHLHESSIVANSSPKTGEHF
jgi:hypothetical protein